MRGENCFLPRACHLRFADLVPVLTDTLTVCVLDVCPSWASGFNLWPPPRALSHRPAQEFQTFLGQDRWPIITGTGSGGRVGVKWLITFIHNLQQ